MTNILMSFAIAVSVVGVVFLAAVLITRHTFRPKPTDFDYWHDQCWAELTAMEDAETDEDYERHKSAFLTATDRYRETIRKTGVSSPSKDGAKSNEEAVSRRFDAGNGSK